MDRERILITVRTYPTFSKRYIETVCTGGINDRGEWRRLYPVPLRYIAQEQQFRTFDIVEVALRPGDDGRPESRKPAMETLHRAGRVDDWRLRCSWVNPTICPSLAAMTEQGRTLAPVTASEIRAFEAEPCDPDWSPEQKDLLQQHLLFDQRLPLEKTPYDFRLVWRDSAGVEHRSLVLSWEMHETFRQYRKRYADPIFEMRGKFLKDVFGGDRQVSLFMGNHSRFRDNWMVCGWFNPPKEQAQHESLF